jgi:hypothetical protein
MIAVASRKQGRSVGVTWHWGGVSEEVITEYGGAKLQEFLTIPEIQFDTQVRARSRILEVFGEDLMGAPCVHAAGHTESVALGAELSWPKDSWPDITDRLLKEPEDIDLLELVRDFMSRPATGNLREMRSYLRAKLGPEAGWIQEGYVGNGPITTARNLRGDQFFADLYERPEWCHRLLEFLTENHILCAQDLWRYQGIEQPEFFHIADDFAGMVSPKLFREFVVPYWKRTFEVLGRGCKDVMAHSELMHPEHLPLLKGLPISTVDHGQDPYITPADAMATGFKTSWNFLDIEVLNGTPESIRSLYKYYVDSGLQAINVALIHRGTPVENVKAILATAREFE